MISQRLLAFKRFVAAWITELEYRLRTFWPFVVGAGARRVFFPGCALTAADPALVMKTFEWLRARDPGIELWSDCCGMPLEKFSTPAAAARGKERTRQLLRAAKTTEIVTACGNCSVQFNALREPGLKITSLYRLMAQQDWGPRASALPMVVHHPCSARIDKGQQEDFSALAGRLGLSLSNAKASTHPLACCLVKTPSAMKRRADLKGQSLVTYCAHCTVSFQKDLNTRHVLQETFGSNQRWVARGKLGRFLQYFRFARRARRLSARPRHEFEPPMTSPDS